MKLEKMTPGMTLYSYGRALGMLGSRPASWPVYVKEVDLGRRLVFASWNGNPPQWFGERDAVRWRKLSMCEAAMKREEKAAAKLAEVVR